MASIYPPVGIESNSRSEEPMSESRRKSLSSLCPKLETNIIVDNFLSSVHCDAEGFLNDHEVEVVRFKEKNFEKVRELIFILKGKDDTSFHKFCSVLVSAGYGHWARKLLEKAELPGDWVQDSISQPREKLNGILLHKKNVFHPEEKELHSRFVYLTGNFEEYVYSLQDIKFRVFRRHCSGFLQSLRAGPLGPSPDLPHDKGPLLDLLNREWNFIDVSLFSDLVDCSNHPNLKEDMEKYKQSLEHFSSQKLSQLEKSIQAMRDSGERLEDGQVLAVILSKDPTLKEIFRTKEFLVNCLRLDKAKFLGFDSGCTILFFAVSLGTSAKPSHLPIGVFAYLHEEFSVCRMLMLGLWAVEISSFTELPGVYELQKLTQATEGKKSDSPGFFRRLFQHQLVKKKRNQPDVTSESFTQVSMACNVPNSQAPHVSWKLDYEKPVLHPRERYTSGASGDVAPLERHRYSRQHCSLPSHESCHDPGSHVQLSTSRCLPEYTTSCPAELSKGADVLAHILAIGVVVCHQVSSRICYFLPSRGI